MNMGKKFLINLINFYQAVISFPLKHLFGGGCRYSPTCSNYAKEAVQKYGIVAGGKLALRRIWRCHPFGKAGYDPLPQIP